jgi:hypothetical protein
MPSSSRILVIVALGALVAAYADLRSTAGAGTEAATATGPATIRITARQFSYNRVDIGPRGRTPGDSEIVFQKLFNKKITTKQLGTSRLICTFTTGITRTCIGTINLPKGELVTTGTLRFRQFYNLAVVGGTGLYDNATGTLTVIRTTQKPHREILLFRLAG